MDLLENDTTNTIETQNTAATVMMAIVMNSNTNLAILNDGFILNQMQSQQMLQQQLHQQSNQHYLVSNNSFELNTATSLSDDSGILHTNSSISSSGSSRLGLCKFEFELAESDGEASQFDSLDNCSDGGMSAENFNTLKKVPLAPIDPPPEFQDSPQTTLLRSQVLQNYAVRLAKNLIENACTIYTKLPDSFKDNQNSGGCNEIDSSGYTNNNNDRTDINNIYDEPPPLIINTINSNSNNSNSNTISSNNSIRSRVKLKKILYSPLHHGSNLSTINRPNSRNSLNSRLSSSHNSLSVNTTNKVDDSIFITQAMSHDALLGKEIIDFYNVPIDSDIYTLPIDFINKQSINNCNNNNSICNDNSSFSFQQTQQQQHTTSSNINNNNCSSIVTVKNSKIHRNNKLKYNKNHLINCSNSNNNNNTSNINKKRRKGCGISNGIVVGINDKYTSKSSKLIKSNDKRHSVPENLIEPMHMTLDEVKRYYHSLYSSSSDSQENLNNNNNSNSKFIHINNTNRKSSSNHTVCNNTITPTSFITSSSTTSTINTKLSSSYINTNTSSSNNNNHVHNHCNNHHGQQSNKINKLNKSSKNCLKKLKDIDRCIEYRGGEHGRQSTSVISNSTTSHSTATNTSAIAMGVGHNTISSAAGTVNTTDLVLGGGDTQQSQNHHHHHLSHKKSSQFSINLNLKQKFCSIFRFRNKNHSSNNNSNNNNNSNSGQGIDYGMTRENDEDGAGNNKKLKFPTRALPPLPPRVATAAAATAPLINNNNNNNVTIKNKNNCTNSNKNNCDTISKSVSREVVVLERPIPNSTIIDFATNIEKVKECGWYWGPISGEAAEKILSNEPDGSFIVRDSSDDHYIFSITFKLSGCIRHVRIDQDQGEFSFGSRALFKSRTITEFIENAVEHSRSGRYLFFLHRRPEHGPMRVQLTNPVSRFRHIQSLQHMCRFVILKAVRKDLIRNLPLPRRLLDYLSYKNYYSEQIESDSPQSQLSGDGSTS